MTIAPERERSSFRDPSGFVFTRDGVLCRQVNRVFENVFRKFVDSGLYDSLSGDRLLVPHDEVSLDHRVSDDAIAVLVPERIAFISYPYEWCFGQLKDAALCTLAAHKRAIEFGMSLKDATSYNVQFRGGKPILIDTLSFEIYDEGKPWIAYKQFCSHFLAPLALMAHTDVQLSTLLRTHLDGIPLDLASKILPWKTRFNPGLAMHIHLHGKFQNKGSEGSQAAQAKVSKTGILALIDSLESAVKALEWTPAGTVWANYYNETNYSEGAFTEKHRIVESFISKIDPTPLTCWDLGANDGEFSRLAARKSCKTIAFDVDPAAVEKAYRRVKASAGEELLPLLQDLTNPSPNLGWAGQERDSLERRGPADFVMALALLHHLAIGNNVPLPWIADYFSRISRWAIIEFVGKEDSQVQRMLSSREDIFADYRIEKFEEAFLSHFEIVAKQPVAGMDRTMYLFRRCP